jgi:hypothetical protein
VARAIASGVKVKTIFFVGCAQQGHTEALSQKFIAK